MAAYRDGLGKDLVAVRGSARYIVQTQEAADFSAASRKRLWSIGSARTATSGMSASYAHASRMRRWFRRRHVCLWHFPDQSAKLTMSVHWGKADLAVDRSHFRNDPKRTFSERHRCRLSEASRCVAACL